MIRETIEKYFDLSMDEKVKLIHSIGEMTDEEFTDYFYKFHSENMELLKMEALPKEEMVMLEETVLARRIAALYKISEDAAYYILEMKKTGTISEEEEKIVNEICGHSLVFEQYFHGGFEDEKNHIVRLADENGHVMEFEFVDLIKYNNDDFAVLLPLNNDEGEVVILLVDRNEGYETYSAVEDQEVISAVFQIFKEKYAEVFDFA